MLYEVITLLVAKKMDKGSVTAFGYESGQFGPPGGDSNPTIPQYGKVYEYLTSLKDAVAVNSETARITSYNVCYTKLLRFIFDPFD